MEIVLDATYLGTKESAHEYLKEMFEFPEYYGCNLDALNDCLGEIANLKIYLENTDTAGEYFDRLIPIFEENAEVEFI